MARKDITFGEPFHRTKQTLLLFCSAIIITRIPGIDVTGSTGVLGVSLKNVDINYIRWGLLACAAYYFVGFLLEALAERHSNTGTSRFGVAESLGDELTNIADQMRQRSNSYSTFQDQLHQYKVELSNSTNQFILNMNEMVNLSKRNELGGRTFVSDTVLSKYENLSETLPESYDQVISRIDESIQYSNSRLDRIDTLVSSLRADVRKFASDIRWWKRLQFYGWDGAGAVAMFAAAIWAAPWPFWN